MTKKVKRMYANPISLILTDSLPKKVAIFTGILRMDGKGKKIAAPSKLKSIWTMAILIAASVLQIAAITAVIVVPMLAPMIKGKTFINETRLFATAGTINDVVTVLDCTAAVKNIP